MHEPLHRCARKRVWHLVSSLFTLALALCGPLGCSDETSIIVEISQGDLNDPPDQLRFFVGLPAPNNDGLRCALGLQQEEQACSQYVYSPDLADAISVENRNLAMNPYRLAVRPSDESDDAPLIVVLAYQNAQLVGAGVLSELGKFRDGEIWEYPMRLKRVEDVFQLGGLSAFTRLPGPEVAGDSPRQEPCLCATVLGVGPVEFAMSGDRDCDGVFNSTDDTSMDTDIDGWTNCSDCQRGDPNIHPMETEECDGVDSDCVPGRLYFPERACYETGDANGNGVCDIGFLSCPDTEDPQNAGNFVCDFLEPAEDGFEDVCTVSEGDCPLEGEGTIDQVECALRQLGQPLPTQGSAECFISYYRESDGSPYIPCPATGWFQGFESVNFECAWQIDVAPNPEEYVVGFGSGLVPPPSPELQSSISGPCIPQFEVAAPDLPLEQLPGEATMELRGTAFFEGRSAMDIWTVDLTPQDIGPIEECPERIFCTALNPPLLPPL